MFAIYKRELYSYFTTPIGYVFMAVFLAVSGFCFSITTLQMQSSDVSTYFQFLMFAYIVIIPLLTMKAFAEERRTRTEQLLLTAPVSLTGMVMAKFLAAFSMFFGTLVVSALYFYPLSLYSEELNWARTTTYTVLKRLSQRGLFRCEEGIVTVCISRDDFYAMQSEKFLEETFDGSLPAFLAAFTARKGLTAEEVAEIRKMIEAYEEA